MNRSKRLFSCQQQNTLAKSGGSKYLDDQWDVSQWRGMSVVSVTKDKQTSGEAHSLLSFSGFFANNPGGFTGPPPNHRAASRSLLPTSELAPSCLFPHTLGERKLMSIRKNVQSRSSWPRVLCEKTILSVRSQLRNPRG